MALRRLLELSNSSACCCCCCCCCFCWRAPLTLAALHGCQRTTITSSIITAGLVHDNFFMHAHIIGSVPFLFSLWFISIGSCVCQCWVGGTVELLFFARISQYWQWNFSWWWCDPILLWSTYIQLLAHRVDDGFQRSTLVVKVKIWSSSLHLTSSRNIWFLLDHKNPFSWTPNDCRRNRMHTSSYSTAI